MMGMSAQFAQHSASVPHLGWGVSNSDGLCGKWGGEPPATYLALRHHWRAWQDVIEWHVFRWPQGGKASVWALGWDTGLWTRNSAEGVLMWFGQSFPCESFPNRQCRGTIVPHSPFLTTARTAAVSTLKDTATASITRGALVHSRQWLSSPTCARTTLAGSRDGGARPGRPTVTTRTPSPRTSWFLDR